jgi:hypothetical protein
LNAWTEHTGKPTVKEKRKGERENGDRAERK